MAHHREVIASVKQLGARSWWRLAVMGGLLHATAWLIERFQLHHDLAQPSPELNEELMFRCYHWIANGFLLVAVTGTVLSYVRRRLDAHAPRWREHLARWAGRTVRLGLIGVIFYLAYSYHDYRFPTATFAAYFAALISSMVVLIIRRSQIGAAVRVVGFVYVGLVVGSMFFPPFDYGMDELFYALVSATIGGLLGMVFNRFLRAAKLLSERRNQNEPGALQP